ncbi:MAG TPA: hypothetical protein VFK47_10895 [Ktedonobacteraceae bacterium]|nr:hypothetical protein [Ktedonobacteraceae bacterium]
MPRLLVLFIVGVLLIIVGLYGNLGSIAGALIAPDGMVASG